MPTKAEILAAQRAQMNEVLKLEVDTFLPALGFERKDKGWLSHEGYTLYTFRSKNGEGMWKCFTDDIGDRRSGNIFHLAMAVNRFSFPHACDFVRSHLNLVDPATDMSEAKASTQSLRTFKNSSHDGETEKKTPQQLANEYETAGKTWTYSQETPLFLQQRCLETCPSKFSGSFKVEFGAGENKALFFPYYSFDETGARSFAGYEKLWKADKKTVMPSKKQSYSRGGRAGLWVNETNDMSKILVLTESPIDCMAFEEVNFLKGFFQEYDYAALRSGSEYLAALYIGLRSREGMKRALLCTDNDAAGLAYASKVLSHLKTLKKEGFCTERLKVSYLPPASFKNDWNDTLAHLIGLRNKAA